MGIDIYAKWRNQTKKEREAQFTGYSTVHGHVGYLREAYHGGPYVTRYLLKEAFDSDKGEAKIPAKVLRQRLPKAIALIKERYAEVYKEDLNEDSDEIKSLLGFIELCEKKEKELGEPVTIIASY